LEALISNYIYNDKNSCKVILSQSYNDKVALKLIASKNQVNLIILIFGSLLEAFGTMSKQLTLLTFSIPTCIHIHDKL